MYQSSSCPSAVVVGIDGSQWSVDAAVWAIDEAISRDVPLRLIYVVEPRGADAIDPEQASSDLACADVSVRRTLVAIESREKPVKVEFEVLQGQPTKVLLEASRSADLVCLGTRGIAHSTGSRLGSIAAIMSTPPLCPVAIVRGGRHWSAQPEHVVVELDEGPDGAHLLDAGVTEARLRDAPLTVLTTYPGESGDVRDHSHQTKALARLNKRLARHRAANPDIEINPVAIRDTTMNYLAHHADSVQLLVVDRLRRRGIGEIIGSARSAPPAINCSVLICQHHGRL